MDAGSWWSTSGCGTRFEFGAEWMWDHHGTYAWPSMSGCGIVWDFSLGELEWMWGHLGCKRKH